MMPSTSKSNGQKLKKLKFVPKPKQRWQVKQPTRNWLDLPSDVMANILYRVGVIDILENAQKVCTTWRKICKDPAMWRVIYMDNFLDPNTRRLQEMCKHAVDRSQGQLVDITIMGFCNDELLQYVADRSSKLIRLQIECCYGELYECWTEALKKLPLLEKLSLYLDIEKEAFVTAMLYSPMLTAQNMNLKGNEMAMAIGENLHELRHLELIGNSMTNIGLQVILHGCRHLELLDLRQCWFINLNGDLGKRCSEQVKCLKLPNGSLKDCPCIYENDSDRCDMSPEFRLFLDQADYEYYGYDWDYFIEYGYISNDEDEGEEDEYYGYDWDYFIEYGYISNDEDEGKEDDDDDDDRRR